MQTRTNEEIRNRVEAALADPTREFDSPMAVVDDAELAVDDKHAILGSWLKDAELLSTAQAENMTGGEDAQLRGVKLALAALATRCRRA